MQKTSRPIVDARTQLGLDQLAEVIEEFEIAIAWADRFAVGDGQPVIYGRPVRVMAEMLDAAKRNLTPAADPVTVALVETRRDMEARQSARVQSELELAVPRQSAPAFANKAGAR